METDMSTPAVIMMITICSLVWGGFIGFLVKAWKIEERKRER